MLNRLLFFSGFNSSFDRVHYVPLHGKKKFMQTGPVLGFIPILILDFMGIIK